MLKLYYAKNSAAFAHHILLEDIGARQFCTPLLDICSEITHDIYKPRLYRPQNWEMFFSLNMRHSLCVVENSYLIPLK